MKLERRNKKVDIVDVEGEKEYTKSEEGNRSLRTEGRMVERAIDWVNGCCPSADRVNKADH